MTEDQSWEEFLSICAVLPKFTIDILRLILDADDTFISKLISSEITVLIDKNTYCLRDDVRDDILARINQQYADRAINIYKHVLNSFFQFIYQNHTSQESQVSEDDLLYHLEQFFLLAASHDDWQMFLDFAYSLRGSHIPKNSRLHSWLLFYEGFIAIHIQNYSLAEDILVQLQNWGHLDPSLQIQIYNALGQMEYFQARYDRALDFYHQTYLSAKNNSNVLYQGFALANMSQVHAELGNYQEALALSERSLKLFRSIGALSSEAYILYEIGNHAMKLGRWPDAQAHFQEAVDRYQALGNQSGLAYVYWGQGFLLHMIGSFDLSEAAYLHALMLSQSQEHPQPALAMDTLLYLGFFYQTQHRWDEAVATYERAHEVATHLHNQHSLSLIHYRLGNVFQRQGRLADAFAAYVQAIDGIEALGGATESEEIKIGLLGTTQQIYEAIVLLCLELGRPADAFHYVERARSRAFLDTLVKKSPELYAALAQPVATLADVQAQLPEGALLLEYFTTGVLPSGEHMINNIPESNARLREHLTLPPQVILFAITRDHCAIHRPALNPNSLRPPVGDRYPGRHLLHGRLPQHLYDRLIAPAAELLASCRTLYLVPHGPLHYVPFTALRSASGAYLLHPNGPALAHAPSATILLRNCIGRPSAGRGAALAIGFNDPQGDQPLRYAEAEAQHVASILGGDAWVGADPKSERLVAASQDIRWLHIAGHARFNPADPLGSELYLGPGDALSARAIIRDLNLAADLVTLSSCTSGVSHVVPGDELLGLQRALLYAGAPAVLCTRWEARDLVSLLLMDHFYTALRQGRPPGVALRDAQIAVRELTSQELAALIERWNATEQITLDAPAATPYDPRSATRELAELDLGAIRDMWRGEAPDLIAALEQPAVQPSALESRPFADPLFWAPFMLVGRA